jgi:hypothetical protein
VVRLHRVEPAGVILRSTAHAEQCAHQRENVAVIIAGVLECVALPRGRTRSDWLWFSRRSEKGCVCSAPVSASRQA